MLNADQALERFIANAKRLMQEQNASQWGMARATGMARTHIQRVLNGKVGVTLHTMENFAQVFGVETWELIK